MQDELDFRQARVSGQRHPSVLMALFFVIIGIQIVIALLGYRYIGLASEYSSRNLIHLDAVTEAQIELEVAQIGVDFPAEKIASLVSHARSQAVWCVDNLSPFEVRMLAAIGSAGAVEICLDDIERADFALELLAKLSMPVDPGAPLLERPFALMAQLQESLRLMLADSRSFSPHVVNIREKVVKSVRMGTAVAGFVSLLIATLLSRTILGNWRSMDLQSREIARQSNRFKLAMESNVDGLALFDAQFRLMTFNERFVSLLHHDPDPGEEPSLSDLLERAIRKDVIVGFDGDGAALLSEIHRAMETGPGSGLQVELRGDRHVVLTRAETGFGDVLLLVRDITLHVRSDREKEAHAAEMQKINATIRESSKRDPLTSLANRRGLDDALLQRSRDEITTIVRIDLDRFKQVNDVFGHEAGDHVLVHVASLLREWCRDEDIPVRVGGDEFLILCAPGTTETDAIELSRRLLEKIREPVLYHGKQLLFGASFGVASSCLGQDDHFTLLQSADAALYVAKNSGRSTVKLFTAELRNAVKRDRALAETFLPALHSGQLKAFAQSIHHAEDWSLAGVEILARWQHPEFGLLAPDAFLPVVKQLGMEADLDGTIFTTALDEMRDIERQGFRFPRISFNVSAGRLLDPDFQEIVQDAMMVWDRRVAFEILETISLDEGSAVVEQIRRLKEIGVQFDVDDFGSDHASINSIIEIGPSTVKIDRKIIQPLGTDDSAEIMLKTIVEMGKAMDVALTAEGIETEEQADIVRRLGGDRLQGYFFSKPMPIAELVRHVSGLRRDRAGPDASGPEQRRAGGS